MCADRTARGAKYRRVRQATFLEKRSASWERLDELATKAGRKSVRGLGAGDADELGRLYRATTSDLSYARGREFDPALVEYLNRLTARAHAYVYGGSAVGSPGTELEFAL